ncbi:genetic competence negative regulator [Paraliobacillus sediminis]|uniref:genetic competence negative regulator n=1 Tax=Paraliobacillus sediminis TaxID=1885916 RepID=UPI000E3BD0CA|nr:genetic competence negative regulator [Paraliobacillus sediminis]
MRLERLSSDQFKIFLTFDDLVDRGLTKEDLWRDLPKMQALFHDMMYEASDELGFELEGVLLVQVHVMQAQGMLIIVTQSQIEDEEDEEDFIEMKVTLDESKELIFLFQSFEDLIQLAIHLDQVGITGGTVYSFEGNYYMELTDEEVLDVNREHIIAILSEFASPSILTSHRLIEYGNTIMSQDAVKQLTKYFAK